MSAITKFVESVCVQQAWYWDEAVAIKDGFGGKTYPEGHPVLIKCRWDDKVERITASNGEEVVSNAQLLVTQDVTIGSYLQLAEPGVTTPPLSTDTAKLARLVTKNALFRSTTEFVRMVYVC